MTETNPTRHVSREFDYVLTLLGDDRVYDVYHDGKAPLNGGGAPGTPKGRDIGRIWNRVTDGVWYATPQTSAAWADITWFHPFYSRREAAMFLVAFHYGRMGQ